MSNTNKPLAGLNEAYKKIVSLSKIRHIKYQNKKASDKPGSGPVESYEKLKHQSPAYHEDESDLKIYLSTLDTYVLKHLVSLKYIGRGDTSDHKQMLNHVKDIPRNRCITLLLEHFPLAGYLENGENVLKKKGIKLSDIENTYRAKGR